MAVSMHLFFYNLTQLLNNLQYINRKVKGINHTIPFIKSLWRNVFNKFSIYLFINLLLAGAPVPQTSIDRFHSRDRWPQWGGETIRNI